MANARLYSKLRVRIARYEDEIQGTDHNLEKVAGDFKSAV